MISDALKVDWTVLALDDIWRSGLEETDAGLPPLDIKVEIPFPPLQGP